MVCSGVAGLTGRVVASPGGDREGQGELPKASGRGYIRGPEDARWVPAGGLENRRRRGREGSTGDTTGWCVGRGADFWGSGAPGRGGRLGSARVKVLVPCRLDHGTRVDALRFLLLDRVNRLERAKLIEASRSVSLTEDYFTEHFPGNPIVPASLLFESFAQAATCLLETSCSFRKKAVPGFVHSAKFHRLVIPGHDLSIQMTVESSTEDATMVSGIARQRDQRCATIKLGMITAPFDDFVPRPFRSFYLAIYDIWLRGANLEGFDSDPLEALRNDGE